MSLEAQCRAFTTPRWLACIYERLSAPFAVVVEGSLPVTGEVSVLNFPNYKLPPYTGRTFTTTDGNITQINYFDGSTQVATRVLVYSSGSIATDTLTIP